MSQQSYPKSYSELWEALQQAADDPDRANLRQLAQVAERVIANVAQIQRLPVAADVVEQLALIYADRAERLLDQLEYGNQYTKVSGDFFDGLVRQSMSIDWDDLLELPLPRKEGFRPALEEAIESVVAEVDKQKVLEALEEQEKWEQTQLLTAHEEDIASWSQAIYQWFEQENCENICLSDLQVALEMPLVKIWLGLLLGNFKLEQRGMLYDNTTILVSPG